MHQLGLLYLTTKKHHLAVFQLEKSLDLLAKNGQQESVLIGKIQSDLGRTHLKLGRTKEAIECFEQAALQQEGMGDCRGLADLYLQLAKSYRSNGEHEKSAKYADRANAIFNGLDLVTLKLKIDYEAAVIRCENKHEDSELEVLQSFIEKFLELGERYLAGNAYLELAKYYLKYGETQKATDSCEEARLLLPETKVDRGRVLCLQGQIFAKVSNYSEAIGCYEKAIGFLKGTDTFSEWDDASRELAQLYLDIGEEKLAYQLMIDGYDTSHQVLKGEGFIYNCETTY